MLNNNVSCEQQKYRSHEFINIIISIKITINKSSNKNQIIVIDLHLSIVKSPVLITRRFIILLVITINLYCTIIVQCKKTLKIRKQKD